MDITLQAAGRDDYPALIALWESSVRATHDFLAEGYLEELKALILEHAFDAVKLCCAKDGAGKIVGFCGLHEESVEMLFVLPESRGHGVGAKLVAYAIGQGAVTVDVNEQNRQAVGFYEHIGFRVRGRSELDGQGRPYPLLHMELAP